MKDKADKSSGGKKYELTQTYKYYATMKIIIYVTKIQQIMFLVHQLMKNFNLPIGNAYCGSVLTVLLLLYQELKEIH